MLWAIIQAEESGLDLSFVFGIKFLEIQGSKSSNEQILEILMILDSEIFSWDRAQCSDLAGPGWQIMQVREVSHLKVDRSGSELKI